ncbi:HtaA domain-containing protein [Streptomyces albipurpureus]|uniref:HtaA domain-containing protein n=1 Tax=Streptomyces albipurpureus TaxID=2897419 RepID=A0ABT0USP5_9ACTN|nr:HtaA domain-containing protein [Streptomyces sp. CWNU-1]MCM2390999.1 HtaA domain-containing protein [Streptomyces sp. CWNU-1]
MPSFRPARAFAVAILAALLGALLPAGAAHAADRTVQGGRLDWGIKSSFQSYVTGPIANGGSRLTSGAATVGSSNFRFHSAKGAYDPATGAFEARFTGGVHFTGHRQPNGSNELDLAISRPTVKISGGRGMLYVDMSSKAKGSGKVTSGSQVAFASLNLGGINMKGGAGPIGLNNIPATLTTQGATAFAGYYTAGTPLDPISLSVDLAAAQQPEKKPAESAKPSKAPKKPQQAGALQDAAVDWGVRRTFREYVTGAIAQGKWTLSGGAQDGGALFRFPQGKGTYDAEKQTLDAAFAGAVRFTGEQLDLTLTQVKTTVTAGKGTLSADVISAGKTEKAVPLITFVAKDFAPKNGLAALTEAPATLTAGGAKAFGGMYKAGTEMDPVSLAVTVDKKAQLPALPDLGSAAEPTPQPSTPKADAKPVSPAATPAASSTESSSPVGAYIAAGAGVLLVAGLALYVVRRRTTQN